MRKSFALATAVLAFGLAACGGGEDAPQSQPATTAPERPSTGLGIDTTTTAPAPEPTVPAGIEDGRDVQRRVEDIAEDFWKKYNKEAEAIMAMSGGEQAFDFDKVVADACEAKATGKVFDDQELGLLAVFIGETLAENGHDIVGFNNDSQAFMEKVAKEVDC